MSTKNTNKQPTKKDKTTTKKSTMEANNSETTKATAKTKEPLISTKKKVGIAMYFTFLATLAAVMGAQMLFSNMMGPTDNVSPADTYTTDVTDNTVSPDDTANNFNQVPIEDDAPIHNVAKPFDNPGADDLEQHYPMPLPAYDDMTKEGYNGVAYDDPTQQNAATDTTNTDTSDCVDCPSGTVCENGECIPLA